MILIIFWSIDQFVKILININYSLKFFIYKIKLQVGLGLLWNLK